MSATKKFTILVAIVLLLQLLLITRQQILLTRTTTLNKNITDITSEIVVIHANIKKIAERLAIDNIKIK
ncbi:MAG: hypothetical protein GY932_15385 [Arcobacter sp.]|nr:hypothetical protein [Arcobacter sp.]